MEEIEKKIIELQKLIYKYNNDNKTKIEEIKIYKNYSKIEITKINWK